MEEFTQDELLRFIQELETNIEHNLEEIENYKLGIVEYKARLISSVGDFNSILNKWYNVDDGSWFYPTHIVYEDEWSYFDISGIRINLDIPSQGEAYNFCVDTGEKVEIGSIEEFLSLFEEEKDVENLHKYIRHYFDKIYDTGFK